MTPANGENSRIGRNCRPVVRPSAPALPVSVRTSQSWATRCIHVPDVGDERTGGEQAVVADAQGGEGRPHVSASRSSSGATRRSSSRSCGVEGAEALGEPGVAAPAVVGEHVAGGVGQLDDDLTTVGVVRPPGHQAGFLEAGDGPRHRRRLDLLDAGQLADRQGAATVERAEHGELVQRAVVAAAFEAQPAGEAHDADAQRAGERGVGDGTSLA